MVNIMVESRGYPARLAMYSVSKDAHVNILNQ